MMIIYKKTLKAGTIHSKSASLIGLTGNIGAGKSFIGRCLRQMGFLVLDTDKINAQLMAYDQGVFNLISYHFPSAVIDNKISKHKLGELAFSNRENLDKLEAIMHPAIRHYCINVIRSVKNKSVVLEIPLLIQNFAQLKEIYSFDCIMLVESVAHIQRKRVLAKKGMSEEKFASIKQRQHTDAAQRQCADLVLFSVNRRAVKKTLHEFFTPQKP